MKSALVFLGLVALSQAAVVIPQDLDGRIVNGEDVRLGEIPWMVSLQTLKDNRHFCGGSILNKDYVITTAHCLEGKTAADLKLVAGTVNLDDEKMVKKAVKIITHEQYNPSWVNDIALIKVDTPFVESETLKFVPLPAKGLLVPSATKAVISGWGRHREGQHSRTLKRANLLTTTHDYCAQVYSGIGYTVQTTHLCANDPKTETGACHGDGGGPLMLGGKMVGMASWTNGCGSTKYPTVFTRVSDFIDWITQHAV